MWKLQIIGEGIDAQRFMSFQDCHKYMIEKVDTYKFVDISWSWFCRLDTTAVDPEKAQDLIFLMQQVVTP